MRIEQAVDGTSTYYLDRDDVISDDIGSPGDNIQQIDSSGALVICGPKSAPAAGGTNKPLGVWPAPITVGGVASVNAKTGVVVLKPGDLRRVVVANAPGAAPATNIDAVDDAVFTGIAANITSMTTGLTGTPVDGQRILWVLTGTGTAWTLAWGSAFESGPGILPGALPASTVPLYVGTRYNAQRAKHVCMGP